MATPDDFIRSFGMSGMLITEELRAIEKRFEIALGHTPITVTTQGMDYYPQFERAVRAEAAGMSEHYELFYCLEQSIRKLITETMKDGAGADWWDTKVPPNIRNEVDGRVKKEGDSGITPRSANLIDYTTFGELGQIILSNWTLFTTTLDNPRAVERVMASLNLLRNPIAHCCPIADDEVDRLQLAVKDWFRLLG